MRATGATRREENKCDSKRGTSKDGRALSRHARRSSIRAYRASPHLCASQQVDDSSNGTWVNDARAVRGRPTQLKSGDHVSLCAPPAERDTKAVCFTFTGYWSGDEPAVGAAVRVPAKESQVPAVLPFPPPLPPPSPVLFTPPSPPGCCARCAWLGGAPGLSGACFLPSYLSSKAHARLATHSRCVSRHVCHQASGVK